MNKKKKILFIHHDNGIGGAPISLSILIKQLDKDRFEPIVLLIKYSTIIEKLFIESGAKVLYIARMFPFHGTTVSGLNTRTFIVNIVGFPITIFRAYFILKSLKADLVYLNTTCLFSFAITSKLINKRIKVISHVREPILSGMKGGPLRVFNKAFVDHFIGISKNDLNALQNKKVKEDLIFNSYNFSNEELHEFNPLGIRQKYKLSKEKVVLLFLGRVSESNGVLPLLHFFKENGSQLQNKYFLIIVGFDRKDESSYSNEVKKIADKLTFCKLIDKTPKIKEYLQGCDYIISPFIEAHFARSIIEGYAYKKPCIVSNVNSQNELLINKETGYLYNDFEELYTLLVNNDLKKDYDSMSKKCFEWGLTNFDEVTNNQKIVKVIYQNL